MGIGSIVGKLSMRNEATKMGSLITLSIGGLEVDSGKEELFHHSLQIITC